MYKMASAEFLEQALSTDVDENAVNAIVGSLENQLVTSDSTVPLQNITLNVYPEQYNITSDLSSIIGVQKYNTDCMSDEVESANFLSPISNNLSYSVLQSPQSTFGPPNFNQTYSDASEPFKVIYSQAHSFPTSATRVGYPTQSIGNGCLNLSSPQNQMFHTLSHSGIPQSDNKTINMQPPLVIKQGTPTGQIGMQPGMVTVPMTVNSSMPTSMPNVMTINKPGQNVVVTSQNLGSAQPILPNVQILNMRGGAPTVAAQKSVATVSPRVVIGTQQVVGTRPAAPGITLQTLQSLQQGQQGHLLLKTETGQYQLLRVGPAPTAGNLTAPQPQALRLSTVPAHPGVATVSTSIAAPGQMPGQLAPGQMAGQLAPGQMAGQLAPGHMAGQLAPGQMAGQLAPGPMAGQLAPGQMAGQLAPGQMAGQLAPGQMGGQLAPGQMAGQLPPGPMPAPVAAISSSIQSAVAFPQAPIVTTQKPSDNTKEKCRNFLANLLDLSSKEPKSVERSVRNLIQELIDAQVEPEEFCDRLERLLNASPQPCLIGFLKKSLPLLRQSLVTKELIIEGINPPAPHVAFSTIPAPTTQQVLSAPNVQLQKPPPKPGSQISVLQNIPVHTKINVGKVGKTMTVNNKGSFTRSGLSSAALSTVLTPGKSLLKEREKRTSTQFSTQPYVDDKMAGDDDINDVTAMGGVNLAEETQRILGSTEMIGTQIRSCKDEHLIPMSLMQTRVKAVSQKHGLDEPSAEVASLVIHAVHERLKNLVEKLAVVSQHRIDPFIKNDNRHDVTHDVKGQLKFLEERDRVVKKRREDSEREMLMRAAKSRSKNEDPEQAKLKAKAKEMQRAELEEVRQREANLTALQAIGPRKKPRLGEGPGGSGDTVSNASGQGGSGVNSRGQMALRTRIKRINHRDMIYLMEQERETAHSSMLYRSYLK